MSVRLLLNPINCLFFSSLVIFEDNYFINGKIQIENNVLLGRFEPLIFKHKIDRNKKVYCRDRQIQPLVKLLLHHLFVVERVIGVVKLGNP